MGKRKLIRHRLSNKTHFILRALLYKGSVAKEHGKQKGKSERKAVLGHSVVSYFL